MNPRVIAVEPNDDYTLTLTFANRAVRVFDMQPHLDLGVFKELRDRAYFQAVQVAGGTVRWPHGQDVCPDTLYEGSKPPGKRPPRRSPSVKRSAPGESGQPSSGRSRT